VAAASDLRPALAVKARAARLVEIPSGTAVGYGGTWIAGRPSLVATLAVGYADGWPRSASPGSRALVRGRPVPVIGRVSMDGIGLDATDAAPVGPDDEFVLIGEQAGARISAADVAAARGTIAREVLTALGPRLPRVYLRGTEPVAIATMPDARIATPR
jgi:alanine racemase